MYPKQITERILELQAKGFSAEETRQAIKEQNGVGIALDTIYRHRKGAVSHEIAEETFKQQQRSILKQDQANPELAMRYRNELLKLLIPQITFKEPQQPTVQNNILINGENVKLDVDITKTLAYYRQALDNANRHNLRSNDTLKQVDTVESQAAST